MKKEDTPSWVLANTPRRLLYYLGPDGGNTLSGTTTTKEKATPEAARGSGSPRCAGPHSRRWTWHRTRCSATPTSHCPGPRTGRGPSCRRRPDGDAGLATNSSKWGWLSPSAPPVPSATRARCLRPSVTARMTHPSASTRRWLIRSAAKPTRSSSLEGPRRR